MLTTLAAIAINIVWPKTYKGTTLIIMAYKAPDPISGLTVPVQLVPNYVATQVDIATSKGVALSVVDQLKLAGDERTRELWQTSAPHREIRDWIAEHLIKNLDVTASRESSVLTLTYKSDSPERAATLANAFAHAYQQMDLQLKVEPLQNAGAYLTQQLALARKQLEEAQTRYSDFQQTHGVFSGDTRDDLESALLTGLTGQIAEVEARLLEAESRKRMVAVAPAGSSADVIADPLTQTLSNNLAVAEARMATSELRYAGSHPNYLSDKASVEAARDALRQRSSLIEKNIVNNVAGLRSRLAGLRAAQSVEKARVMALNSVRDQLAILKREVDSATRGFDLLTQRSTQLSLEGRADRSDIAILSAAMPDYKPAGPGLSTVVVIAVILGSLLGCAIAVFQEFTDARIRSIDDAGEILSAPFLGGISHSPLAIGGGRPAAVPLTRQE